ncbi:GYD domain-containing protein [Vibrio superstes]|uniref:GYD domain-containing protein n=1 Tax=Vibrio superstes NBRC 103154 TaxID=1219062 RepID=A0A511QT72_9VIBR|nr:GYD domain-containing protein [Vibrio superstes]GEM80565.1 hypothetical protein VSU01S_28100 [Vibrio superstes NBRC 103154]
MSLIKKLFAIASIAIAATFSFTAPVMAKEETTMKCYLMIAKPNAQAWAGVIQSGGNMEETARPAIEAMGGELVSYWLAVGEPMNYGVVAFPSSLDIAKITYMRTAQGFMDKIEFIEVMDTKTAEQVFKSVKDTMDTKK